MAIAGLALSSVIEGWSQFQEGPPPDARADLQPKRRGGLCLTDSDHDIRSSRISPATGRRRPDQLWVADITYIAIARVLYLAASDAVTPRSRLRD